MVRVIRSGRVQPEGAPGGEGVEGLCRTPGGPLDNRLIIFWASGFNAYRVFSKLTGFHVEVAPDDDFSGDVLSEGDVVCRLSGGSSGLISPCWSCAIRSRTEDELPTVRGA
jgi:hypothetical protein